MKFRNRGKHGFKRLKKQMQVYDYCKTRISRGDTFQIVDIANDLGISHTTVVEILQELNEKDSNFIYSRGCIKIKGIGNNGFGKIAEDEKGLVVKTVSRSTKARLEKKERVFNYLCYLVNSNQKIPCLSYLSKNFTDMHMTTVMDILKQLDKENKIIYKRGQVVAVNVPSVTGNREKTLKYNNGEEIKEENKIENDTIDVSPVQVDKIEYTDSGVRISTSTTPVQITETPSVIITDNEKYDKAVKDLVAEYILNANITTREEIVEYVDSIMKITDKLKDKLY